jgi:hypothetical protein
MHRHVSALIAVIALAVPLVGCGGGGGAASQFGESAARRASDAARRASEASRGARDAGSEAWDATSDLRQIHSAGCRKAQLDQWSDALQGEAGGEDAPTC